MRDFLAVPRASADAVEHADWLELSALAVKGHSASLQDLVRAIHRSGTVDAVEEGDMGACMPDRGEEKSQAIGEAALAEIHDRNKSIGSDSGRYPFEIDHTGQLLRACDNAEESTYAFLLLLSLLEIDKDKVQADVDATRLFEELCASAAEVFFGGPHPMVKTRGFGFPRRNGPRSFAAAVDSLCTEMGEGRRHYKRDTLKDQKDAKLDLVVWRDFLDGRQGKLVGFAQCKTGRHWRDYLRDLQPKEFCRNWLREMPPVDFIRLYFVPNRIESNGWYEASSAAGILFDRCRILECATNIDSNVAKNCKKWTKQVFKNKLVKQNRN